MKAMTAQQSLEKWLAAPASPLREKRIAQYREEIAREELAEKVARQRAFERENGLFFDNGGNLL